MATTFTAHRPPEPLETLFVTPLGRRKKTRSMSVARLKQRIRDMESELLQMDLTPLASNRALPDELEQMYGRALLEPLLESSERQPSAGLDEERRQRSLRALRFVQDTLELSDAAAVGIAGVSRNTVRSWRREERSPYPSTVRQLFEVESVLRSLIALLGLDGARNWLRGLADGTSRMDLLGDADGARLLASQMRSDLFPGMDTVQFPAAGDLDEGASNEPGYDADAFAGSLRRRRSRS